MPVIISVPEITSSPRSPMAVPNCRVTKRITDMNQLILMTFSSTMVLLAGYRTCFSPFTSFSAASHPLAHFQSLN